MLLLAGCTGQMSEVAKVVRAASVGAEASAEAYPRVTMWDRPISIGTASMPWAEVDNWQKEHPTATIIQKKMLDNGWCGVLYTVPEDPNGGDKGS